MHGPKKGEKMSALKWYAECDYIRGGRSADGQQVRLEGETGLPFLNSIAKYLASLAEPRPQREEDKEDEEEDRGRKMTMSQVCNDILRFFNESGVDKKNGYYSQIDELKKRGKAAIDSNLWRILKPEVKQIYSDLFRKKVSTRR